MDTESTLNSEGKDAKMSNDLATDDSSNSLQSDKLDKKRSIDESEVKKDNIESTAGVITTEVVPDYDWSKQLDTSTGYYYFYNFRTGQSQWEQPSNYIDTSQYSSANSLYASSVTLGTSDIGGGAVATFNAKTGSFSSSGQKSYWEQVGRQTDREGRQMSGIIKILFHKFKFVVTLYC
jgi:hypothetical protein